MPSVDSYVSSNSKKTAESSNFGTRKLAFYTLQMNPSFGLATTWQQQDSLYYQIIQKIQSGMQTILPAGTAYPDRQWAFAGAELMWVGTPRFTLDPKLLDPRTSGTVVKVDGTSIYVSGNLFNDEFVYYGMPFQVAENFGNLIANTTYYVSDWHKTFDLALGNCTVITVSATFSRENYNTKSTGSDFDAGTATGLIAFIAGGFDPVDASDIQPNFLVDTVDRGYDCMMFAVTENEDYDCDCGPNPSCDFDSVFGAVFYQAVAEMIDDFNPSDIFVFRAQNEYGIFPSVYVDNFDQGL